MKATELRIGNWVRLNVRPIENYQVTQILEKGVNCGLVGAMYEIVKPIPLTDEWLKRFGFNEDGFKQYEFENWGIKVKKDPHAISETNWIVFHGFMNQFSELVSLKHVHQLQNLYFALTGEELQTDENDQKVNQ